MAYLLDTNICIYIIKQKPPAVLERFQTLTPAQVGLSVVTVAELEYGARKSGRPQKNLSALQQFFLPFNLFDFDSAAAEVYGQIRSSLEQKGTPIGPLDMFIAAHAVSLGCILVTNNEKEFRRVPGLRIENWV